MATIAIAEASAITGDRVLGAGSVLAMACVTHPSATAKEKAMKLVDQSGMSQICKADAPLALNVPATTATDVFWDAESCRWVGQVGCGRLFLPACLWLTGSRR
jgi:hypothetical protein